MRFLSTIILSILSLLYVPADAQRYIFEHLGVQEGLSQVTINDIYQDGQGMMWFATRDGLNKYDGNKISIYQPIYGDTTSIPASKVLSLTGDSNGVLYLSISGNLVTFDTKTELFKKHNINISSNFSHNKNGILWISDKKIYSLESSNALPKLEIELSINEPVRHFAKSIKDEYWIGTSQGLYRVSLDGTNSTNILPQHIVRHIIEDKQGDIWVCTENKGLVHITESNKFEYYRPDQGMTSSIISDFIRCGSFDQSGNLWLGSPDGLSCFNPQTGSFQNYSSQPENSFGLSFKSITSIFADRRGTIWFGTYFGGINYMNPQRQPFKYYHSHEGDSKPPVVGEMTEDKDGIIWICTGGGYLSFFNPKNEKFQIYDTLKNTTSSKNIKSIWYDESENCLWLGTIEQSLDRLDLSTKTVASYNIVDDKSGLFFGQRINVNKIIPYQGKLLLAMSKGGLRLFDTKKKTSELYLEMITSEITSVFQDTQGYLWVAANGIYKYNTRTDELKHYTHNKSEATSLNSNSINTIFEDSEQRIWIGTAGFGLNLYHPQTDNFSCFTKEKDGILHNNILAISESPDKTLFVTTYAGISAFNPTKKEFVNYDYRNGFPLRTVNEKSLYIARDGSIYVGGIPGMTSFKENDLQDNRSPFNIIFTKLYIDNHEVRLYDNSNILIHPLPFTNEISLKPKYSSFSIEFSTDEYIKTTRQDVQYRLLGYDNKWIDAKLGRLITYTNLNSGDYILEVRPTDFPDAVKSMKIIVEPPFYKTPLAYLVYFLIIASLTYWAVKLLANRWQRKKNEEIMQMQIKFFTNVSHEIRTPVTLIIGQLEHMLELGESTGEEHRKILKVYKNATTLKELISELLDFSKQESKGLKLKVSEVDLVDYTQEIFSLFQEHASNNRINFQFIHPPGNVGVWIDTKQMQKVIQNLLSNAFKYTDEGGNITIQIIESKSDIALSVTDDGIGINKNDQKHIFERFYQSLASTDKAGTGIGLALVREIVSAHKGTIKVYSKPKQGSCFYIKLRKGSSHFPENIKKLESPKNLKDEIDHEPIVATAEQVKSSLDTTFPRLLIVEDNVELRELLIDIFKLAYRINVAVDGQDAWEKVKEINPDIIISDIMMPRMSGVDFCIKLKGDFETSHIPIILLTAKSSVENMLEGLQQGADDYVTKPFDINLLLARCNNLVTNRTRLQKKFIHQHNSSALEIATNSMDLDFINKATEVVENNITNEKFDIDIFAQEMGLGRTTFFNKLKGITGMTPLNFIANIKLKKASELLINSPEMNVSDIAYFLGYKTPHYFSESFKTLYGEAPLAYRNKHK